METSIHTPPPRKIAFLRAQVGKGTQLFLRLRDKLRAGAKSPLSFWERARVRASLGYDILRILLAAVLLTAAVLKTYELATGPVLGNGLLDSRWLLMAVVEFELFFGIWLLSGFYPRQTWAAAILCFGIFACVSLYKALAGHASCGCFGPVPINPWYTTAFDAAIVLLLLYWRPRGLSRLSLAVILKGTDGAPCEAWSRWSAKDLRGTANASVPLRSLSKVFAIWLLLALPAGYSMATYTDATLSEVGEIVGDGNVVVLQLEKWIGRRFPLLDYIDIGDQIVQGNWMVVFYHQDCPKCQDALINLDHVAKRYGIFHVALIGIPPYRNSVANQAKESVLVLHSQLSKTREWFIQTPFFLLLDNGEVMATELEVQPILADYFKYVN